MQSESHSYWGDEMKLYVRCLTFIAVMFATVGCTEMQMQGLQLPGLTSASSSPSPAANCPPAGTAVPFGKIMTTALLRNYEGCNVATTATFVGTGSGTFALGGVENDHIIIRAVPPGESVPSGLQAPIFVALPINGSDLAFELKTGDVIRLSGGTRYNRFVPTASVFVATSIARAS